MLDETREKKLIDLCANLIRIQSYSGAEAQIVEQLRTIFQTMDCPDIHVDAFGSITAQFTGRHPGITLLFDAHVDTVPVMDPAQWTHDPFGGCQQNQRIHGRGASDMKGALAAMIMAAACFMEDTNRDFAGKIAICGGVHEESFEGIAARRVSQRLQPDVVVIGEATDLNLAHGQRGRAEIVVETFGKPAHSATPEAGVNAVYHMIQLIQAIKAIAINQHAVLGRGILELTDIKSTPYPGLSVIPHHCRATFDRRLLVGETKETVLAPVQELIDRFMVRDPDFNARASYANGSQLCYTGAHIQAERFFPAWQYNQEDAFLQTARQGLTSMGLSPSLKTYSFCTNGSHYAGQAGLKTLGFGPSRENQAHVNDEFIAIDHLTGACRGYYGIMRAFTDDAWADQNC